MQRLTRVVLNFRGPPRRFGLAIPPRTFLAEFRFDELRHLTAILSKIPGQIRAARCGFCRVQSEEDSNALRLGFGRPRRSCLFEFIATKIECVRDLRDEPVHRCVVR